MSRLFWFGKRCWRHQGPQDTRFLLKHAQGGRQDRLDTEHGSHFSRAHCVPSILPTRSGFLPQPHVVGAVHSPCRRRGSFSKLSRVPPTAGGQPGFVTPKWDGRFTPVSGDLGNRHCPLFGRCVRLWLCVPCPLWAAVQPPFQTLVLQGPLPGRPAATFTPGSPQGRGSLTPTSREGEVSQVFISNGPECRGRQPRPHKASRCLAFEGGEHRELSFALLLICYSIKKEKKLGEHQGAAL